MNVLASYRDDGPLATLLGRALGRVVPLSAPLLTLLGGVVLAAAVVTVNFGLARPWLGAAVVVFVLLAGAAAGRAAGGGRTGRLDWTVPPMLRAVEYGTLLGFAIHTGPRTVTACFVFLAVLAYHHYNIVYRLRHQDLGPPRWLGYVGGGWELRLLVAYVLLLTGGLAIGMLVAAVLLAVIYVTETVAGWRRFTVAARPALYEQEEDEDL